MRGLNLIPVPLSRKRTMLQQRAVEIAITLIDLDDLLINKTDTPALTPQTRLLLGLLIQGSMQMKDALRSSPLSYRAFYVMITKLTALGLIQTYGVEDDRRIRRVRLGRRASPLIKLLATSWKALVEKDTN